MAEPDCMTFIETRQCRVSVSGRIGISSYASKPWYTPRTRSPEGFWLQTQEHRRLYLPPLFNSRVSGAKAPPMTDRALNPLEVPFILYQSGNGAAAVVVFA